MQIRRADFQTCSDADGTVVVFDVLRAFSGAAGDFSRGAREIVLAVRLDEALALRREMPDARLFGEVGGSTPPGSDFPNSPARLAEADLGGRRLIQYTGAGIEGVLAFVPGRFLADVRHPEYEEGDSACCTAIDYVLFVMRVHCESGRLVVRASG